MELPITPVGRILKNKGAQKISDDAKNCISRSHRRIWKNSSKYY